MPIMSFLLQAASGAAGGDTAVQGASGLGMLIPLLLIIVIMYFFMIRPQNKKQKELQRMLDALKKGDKVVTIGGIHGVVTHVNQDKKTVTVKVDENTKLEFTRSAISGLDEEKPAAPAKEAPKERRGLFGRRKSRSDEEDIAAVKSAPAAEIKDATPAPEKSGADTAVKKDE